MKILRLFCCYCFFAALPVKSSADATFAEVYQAFQQAEQQGDYESALRYARTAFTLGQSIYQDDAESLANLQYNLANMLNQTRQYVEAYEHITQVQSTYRQLYGESSSDYFKVSLERLVIGSRYKVSSQRSVAKDMKALTRELMDVADILAESQPQNAAHNYYLLANTIATSKNVFVSLNTAIQWLNKANDLVEETYGQQDKRAITLNYHLGAFYKANNKRSKAIDRFESVVEMVNQQVDFTHPYELGAHARLVGLYEDVGESDKATEHCIAIGEMTPWQDDIEPTPLYRVNPKYPMDAARKKMEGWVRLGFSIDEMGFVQNIVLVEHQGTKRFATEAMKAMKQWRYAPKFVDGQPVKAVDLRVQIDFKMGR